MGKILCLDFSHCDKNLWHKMLKWSNLNSGLNGFYFKQKGIQEKWAHLKTATLAKAKIVLHKTLKTKQTDKKFKHRWKIATKLLKYFLSQRTNLFYFTYQVSIWKLKQWILGPVHDPELEPLRKYGSWCFLIYWGALNLGPCAQWH